MFQTVTGGSDEPGSDWIRQHLVVDDLQQFRTIIEALPTAIVIVQGDATLYVNPYTESITGYSKDELMAIPFWGIVHPDCVDMVMQRGRSRQAGKAVPDQYDLKIVRKDGEVRWINWRASVITLDGKPAVMGVGEDITERRRKSEQIEVISRLSACTIGDDYFHSLVESLVDVLHLKVAFVAEFEANDPATARSLAIRIDGKHSENIQWELRGTPCEQVANGEWVFVGSGVQQAFPDDRWLSEHNLESYVGVPMLSSRGEVMGHIGIMDAKPMHDRELHGNLLRIFAQRAAAELEQQRMRSSLRSSELNFYNLIESNVDAIVVSRDYNILYANSVARQMFEVPQMDRVTGTSLLKFIHPRYRQFAKSSIRRVIRRGESISPITIQSLSATGRVFDVEMTSIPVHFEQAAAIMTVVRDVSEIKRRNDTLRKLSSALECAGESIMITDRDGVIEYVNPAFTALTGYSAEEAIGKTPRLLNSGNQDAAFYADMWETISSGRVWHGKVIDKKRDGSFYPARLTIAPVFSHGGYSRHHTHYVGIQADLTDIENLEQQFYQAQKMDAIGTLVGGIAHDFKQFGYIRELACR